MAKTKKIGMYQNGGDVDTIGGFEPSPEQAEKYRRTAQTLPRSSRIEDRRGAPIEMPRPLDPLYEAGRQALGYQAGGEIATIPVADIPVAYGQGARRARKVAQPAPEVEAPTEVESSGTGASTADEASPPQRAAPKPMSVVPQELQDPMMGVGPKMGGWQSTVPRGGAKLVSSPSGPGDYLIRPGGRGDQNYFGGNDYAIPAERYVGGLDVEGAARAVRNRSGRGVRVGAPPLYAQGGSVLGVDPSARPPGEAARRALATVHRVIHHGHHLFGMTGPGTRFQSRSPFARGGGAPGFQTGGNVPDAALVQAPTVPEEFQDEPGAPAGPLRRRQQMEQEALEDVAAEANKPERLPPLPRPEPPSGVPLDINPMSVNPNTRQSGPLNAIPESVMPSVVPGEAESPATPAGEPGVGLPTQANPTEQKGAYHWSGGTGANPNFIKTYMGPGSDAAGAIDAITKAHGPAADTPESLAAGASGYQALRKNQMAMKALAGAALKAGDADKAAEFGSNAENAVPDSFKTTIKPVPGTDGRKFSITRQDTLNGPDPVTGAYPTTTHVLTNHQLFAYFHGPISEIDHQTLHRDDMNRSIDQLSRTNVPNMPGWQYGAPGAKPYEISRGHYVIGKPEEFTPEQLRGAAVREQFRGLPTVDPRSQAGMQREKEISGAIFPSKNKETVHHEPSDNATAILQHYDRVQKLHADGQGPPPDDNLEAARRTILTARAGAASAARAPGAAAAPAPAAAGPAAAPAAAPTAGIKPLMNQTRPHQGGGNALMDIWNGTSWVPLAKE